MSLQSFAALIAVALVAAGISLAVLMIGIPCAIASTYGLATRTTRLG